MSDSSDVPTADESTEWTEASDVGETTTDGEPDQETDLNLDPTLQAAISYWGTIVTGLPIGLLFVLLEEDNDFVRFHGLQSSILFLAVTVVGFLFGMFALVFSFLTAGIGTLLVVPLALLFAFGYVAVLVYAGWRGLQGDRYRLPMVADYADQYV